MVRSIKKRDRIASAWLIRGFIDKKATFGFIDETEVDQQGKDTMVFDVVGGQFTHVGDLCTFEVLVELCSTKPVVTES